jgi:hypothetical protein
MFYRCLPHWIVLALALAMPQERTRGGDVAPATPKAANAAAVADDPAAVEAFKKAGIYRFCKRDKDGNVVSALLGGQIPFEKPESHRLDLRCYENFKGFPKLRKIETRNGNPNEQLDYIADLDQLETLEIHNTGLDNDGLAAIQGMAKLKRLSLSINPNVRDAGLEHLAGLKSLEELDLSDTGVRGTGLSWLKGLKNLKKLNLSGNKFGDAQIRYVTVFSTLEELDLSATLVTSDSLGQLSVLTRLKLLDVSSITGTQAGAEELKKSLPNLKIILPQPPRPAQRRKTGITHSPPYE